ncbi:MAG: FtsQ-type POTRA domain-containing protein [Clostridia bacterium]|nr:FtsQ-type POTRA domain-containing protein [Clostridia bacterium]
MYKKRKKKKSMAIPVAFCCLLIMAVMITLFMMPFFNIKNIRVTGNEALTQDQIKGYLTFAEGDNIFLFNKNKCKDTILSNHYVESVSINRILPSTVEITMSEYKLRGYVPYSGSYLFIDGEGRVLDVQKQITKALPVVEGLKFNNVTVGEILQVDNPSTFETMVHLSKLFEKYELLSDVIRVDMTDVTDIHLYTGNVDIKFGSFDDANRKLLMLIEVLKTFDTSVPGTINLTADKATYKYML